MWHMDHEARVRAPNYGQPLILDSIAPVLSMSGMRKSRGFLKMVTWHLLDVISNRKFLIVLNLDIIGSAYSNCLQGLQVLLVLKLVRSGNSVTLSPFCVTQGF